MNSKVIIKNDTFTMELDPESVSMVFDEKVRIGNTAGKKTGEMLELLQSSEVSPDIPLYDFFVGVSTDEDKETFNKSKLRYDVIMVYPGKVNDEYKKTSGHMHKKNSGFKNIYPEIYEVLYGTAMFLLQKVSDDGCVECAAAVETKAGQKILIPPGYEHATVNIGTTPLVFSDLISIDCENEYGGVKEHGGMCYFVVEEDGKPAFRKNPKYKEVPEMQVIKPIEQQKLSLVFDKYVYDIAKKQPKAFEYLSNPDMYSSDINYLADFIEGKKHKFYFAPSLMCMDLLNLPQQLDILNRKAEMYHVDIMDGHYVKNITLSPMFIEQIRKMAKLPIDAHLMVENPNDFIEIIAKAGADYISVHAETINKDAFRTIQQIRNLGCKVGVVLNPATPLSDVQYYLHLIDKLTIMTVDAGFAGQKFIPKMLEKIEEAAKIREQNDYHYLIEIDGSCNEKTFGQLIKAGCEVFIVGSSGLFNLDSDLETAYEKMQKQFNNAVIANI